MSTPHEQAAIILNKIADAFGIGSEARKEHGVILTCLENTIRRANCLSAIEREFFTRCAVDEDGNDYEERLLNWGSTPEQYVEQYREITKHHFPAPTLESELAEALRVFVANHKCDPTMFDSCIPCKLLARYDERNK